MLEFYYMVEISSRFDVNQLTVDALVGFLSFHAGIYYAVDAAAEFSFGKVFMLEFDATGYSLGYQYVPGIWWVGM